MLFAIDFFLIQKDMIYMTSSMGLRKYQMGYANI